MKILHYIPGIDQSSGGTTAYMQLLGKYLGEFVELHIVSHLSSNIVEIPNTHIHFISPNLFGGLKKEWVKVLDEVKPDIVHINCCWMPQCAYTQKWAQSKGFKVILTPHGMLEPWIMARNYWTKKKPALLLYQKDVIINADYLHATAESEKNNLLKLKYNNHISVIPNGIEVTEIRIKNDWEPKKKILFLSRVHIKKGIEILIESVAQIKVYLVGYEVIIAGEGDAKYIELLKRKIADCGVSDIFNFVGGIYGDQKWKLFQDADFFVLPTFSENFGIVIGESLASGTPVITTTGTPWEEIDKYNCGWCIELSTANLRAALLDAIHKNAEELKLMGRNGRSLIEEKYDIKNISKEMFEFYQRV